jgi:uncharacterized protein YecE (DUF72 family)
MPVLIGTSGWHYRHWRGGPYPSSLPAHDWLGYYAEKFATVEINNAFYRLPELSTFANWAETVPDDFVVSVKASRYLTHIRRLQDPEEAIRLLMERSSGLGRKLGPILVQLPPNLRVDLEALSETLHAFPPGTKLAVEFRHESWFDPAVRRLLEDVGAAWCLADRAGPQGPLWRTTDWGYLRLHHGNSRPPSCYGPAALGTWARRLAELWSRSADVFVYFNNDGYGCAPRDAHRFASVARRAGLLPTRVPAAHDVPLTSS